MIGELVLDETADNILVTNAVGKHFIYKLNMVHCWSTMHSMLTLILTCSPDECREKNKLIVEEMHNNLTV